MMKKTSWIRHSIIALIIIIVITGCYEFEFVNQPFQADPNSYFEVDIAVLQHQSGVDYYPVFFGTLIPLGWIPEDSVVYYFPDSTDNGILVYSDTLSLEMEMIDPPPSGYYWWVATDTCIYDYDGTYNAKIKIFTDNQTGTFFIDYMLGDAFDGLNRERSNEHFIIIGDPPGCAPEGIVFSNQQEVDSFPLNYIGCDSIAGHIFISGDDIVNLDSLEGITSIGGNLKITGNVGLTDISGLHNLSSIGGSFYMYGNDSLASLSALSSLSSIGRHIHFDRNLLLQNLTGLEGLTSIGGNLRIEVNPALASLTGLDNVTSIGGRLWINGNHALTSMTGLNNLISIGGRVSFSHNNALTSLTGLSNVTSIGGELSFYRNDALTSLTGLEGLTSIGGELYFNRNDALTSLTGLEGLTSIGGCLWIEYNPALASLTGLDNINASSISDLYIRFNNLLATCEVQSICDYLVAPNGEVWIHNNSQGCGSQHQVELACEATYLDEMNNLQNIYIYPNPTQSSLTIELSTQPSNNTTLTISNTNGQQLITQPITEPQTEIDITHLPTGIYIVKVWNDKDVMVRKVIKQ